MSGESGERGKRVQGSARIYGSGESRDEPVGSQVASDKASRFSDFYVHDTNNVHVGSANYVKGGPIININIGPGFNPAELLYGVSIRLNGAAPDPFDTLYHVASPLSPGSDYRGSSPADQPHVGHFHRTQDDMAISYTRHQAAIASQSGQRESPRNHQRLQNHDNVTALAERIQRHEPRTWNRAGSGRREAKSSWGQRLLRVCTQSLRGNKE